MTLVQTSLSAPVAHRPSGRTRLASILASRLCHDLVSPLGAIANGLELLALTAPPSAEGDLIAESAAAANARLRFFRLAYGPATFGQVTSHGEVSSTLRAIARGGRTTYAWDVEGDHPRTEIRLVMLVLQCLEASMPMGGTVRITQDHMGWVIHGEGPQMRVDQELWLGLRPGRGVVTENPAHLQFSFLSELLFETGRMPTLMLSDRYVTVRV